MLQDHDQYLQVKVNIIEKLVAGRGNDDRFWKKDDTGHKWRQTNCDLGMLDEDSKSQMPGQGVLDQTFFFKNKTKNPKPPNKQNKKTHHPTPPPNQKSQNTKNTKHTYAHHSLLFVWSLLFFKKKKTKKLQPER